MASQTQTGGFEEWASTFRRSRVGKQALGTLDKLAAHGEPRDFRKLQAAVLQTCYHASQFDSAPWTALFRHQKAYRKFALAQREHVDALIKFIELYPQESRHTLLHAIATLDGTVLEVKSHAPYPWLRITEAVGNLLNAYADVLPQAGPYPAANVKLPLLYPIQLYLQDNPRDIRLDGLIFTLAIRFKDWTHLATVRVLDTGMEMPEYGRACNECIAQLVKATLKTESTARKVMDSLRKMPKGTKFGSWGKVELQNKK